MPYRDPQKQKEAQAKAAKKHYEANKDKMKVRAAFAKKVKMQELHDLVDKYKAETPCVDCKKIFDPVCMDYDHLGSNKFNSISRMIANGNSWERIETEIAKCELVCANCHRIRTSLRRQALVG
jgi:hypothetical protein